MTDTGGSLDAPRPAFIRRIFLSTGVLGLCALLLAGCVAGERIGRDGVGGVGVEGVRSDGNGMATVLPEAELISLSDRTRVDFSLDSSRLDSVQFYVDQPVTYIGMQTDAESTSQVDRGAVIVSEEQTVRIHRVVIEARTPGVAVGRSGATGPEAEAWETIDIDFGGFVVPFEGGRGGRTGEMSRSNARRSGVRPPTPDDTPILYYAPVSAIRTDSVLYRLDRRSYTGATLAFGGAYRSTRKEETTRVSPAGRIVYREEPGAADVPADPPAPALPAAALPPAALPAAGGPPRM